MSAISTLPPDIQAQIDLASQAHDQQAHIYVGAKSYGKPMLSNNTPQPPSKHTASTFDSTGYFMPKLNPYTGAGAFIGLGLGYGIYSTMAKRKSWLILAGYCFGGAMLGYLVAVETKSLKNSRPDIFGISK